MTACRWLTSDDSFVVSFTVSLRVYFADKSHGNRYSLRVSYDVNAT